MGKGDIKSRRGKIRNGSYGKRRPRKARKASMPQSQPTTAPKKKSAK
jgi:30S ribosomal protein S31